jgi:hypothetical protein
VPHAFGPGIWWGEEVFGLNNLLVPDWPITEIQNGKPVIVAKKSLTAWLDKPGNKDLLFKSLKKWNMK